MENTQRLSKIKDVIREKTDEIAQGSQTRTKPGSLKYLLFGETVSEQSLSIKFGKVGEVMFKEMIKTNPNLCLLDCGIQNVNDSGKKKDIDLIWMNEGNKTIYYREAKGNIEMDTEKLPAMIAKMKGDITEYIKKTYPEYTVDVGVLCWSVYDREILNTGINHIRTCEGEGIKVDHVKDMLDLTGLVWDEDDFYSFMKEMGNILNPN